MAAILHTLLDRLFGLGDRLAEAARTPAGLAALLATFAVVWTLYHTIAFAGVDLHVDLVETYAFGREWQLGYFRNPPLFHWIAGGLWFELFPRFDWAFYLLAMAVAALALACAWVVARDEIGADKARLSIFVLMLLPVFQFQAYKYNNNTLMMLAWPLTGLCFLRSIATRDLRWAFAAGAAAAAAMLVKYYGLFFLAGLGIAALVHPERGRYFRSLAPWVTAIVGLVIFSPHLYWLTTAPLSPIDYALDSYANLGHGRALLGSLMYLVRVVAVAALALGVLWWALKPTRAALRDIVWPTNKKQRFLLVAFAAPILLPAVVAPFFGHHLHTNWIYGAWYLLPVVLLGSPLVKVTRQGAARVAAVVAVVTLAALAASPGIALLQYRLEQDAFRTATSRFARQANEEFRAVAGKPLRIVAGDFDLAVAGAFYALDRPRMATMDLRVTPWIGLADIRRDGAVVLCRVNSPCNSTAADWAVAAGGARVTTVTLAPEFMGRAQAPARAILHVILPRAAP